MLVDEIEFCFKGTICNISKNIHPNSDRKVIACLKWFDISTDFYEQYLQYTLDTYVLKLSERITSTAHILLLKQETVKNKFCFKITAVDFGSRSRSRAPDFYSTFIKKSSLKSALLDLKSGNSDLDSTPPTSPSLDIWIILLGHSPEKDRRFRKCRKLTFLARKKSLRIWNNE